MAVSRGFGCHNKLATDVPLAVLTSSAWRLPQYLWALERKRSQWPLKDWDRDTKGNPCSKTDPSGLSEQCISQYGTIHLQRWQASVSALTVLAIVLGQWVIRKRHVQHDSMVSQWDSSCRGHSLGLDCSSLCNLSFYIGVLLSCSLQCKSEMGEGKRMQWIALHIQNLIENPHKMLHSVRFSYFKEEWDALSCNVRRVISCVACSEACLWFGPPSKEQANRDAPISQTRIRPENNIRQAFVYTTCTLKEIINPPRTRSGIGRVVCVYFSYTFWTKLSPEVSWIWQIFPLGTFREVLNRKSDSHKNEQTTTKKNNVFWQA